MGYPAVQPDVNRGMRKLHKHAQIRNALFNGSLMFVTRTDTCVLQPHKEQKVSKVLPQVPEKMCVSLDSRVKRLYTKFAKVEA